MKDFSILDNFILKLNSAKNIWVQLPIDQKISKLKDVKNKTGKYREEWVRLALKNKEIDINSQLRGEECSTGPWALITTINAYIETLEKIKKGNISDLIKGVETRDDGQLKVQVFPSNFYENLLFNQIKGEVWMQKGVTSDNLLQNMAGFYLQENPEGKVSLVLGAGNINSIAPLDVLYNLIVKGEVALLKMNPVNEYLIPIFEKIFESFIKDDFVKIIDGGIEVGKYLTAHPDIETIHITGSEKTHDAIVYGVGEEGKKRKKENKPILDADKPIRSELGGIGPMIVVPGPWNKKDLDFQAQNIVTAKLHNGGHNCVASQVLILPNSWKHSEELLSKVREYLKEIPYRKAYYPGSEIRQKEAKNAYPNAEELVGDEVPRTLITNIKSNNGNEYAFNTEFFGAVFAQTDIKGDTPLEFLKNTVDFCNNTLHGTLGATILIHPDTMKEMGVEFENCIADLKYGAIGINVWNAVAFLLPQCTWGAFPGHTYDDIQSGIGVVHNSLMFDKPEKTVLYGPFRTLPRALNLAPPKPPWYVTNKTGNNTLRKITDFAINPSFLKLPGIFISALRG
ncbi:MAG: aldehyde dehydrogenase family protein [Bacteroidota bacterium]